LCRDWHKKPSPVRDEETAQSGAFLVWSQVQLWVIFDEMRRSYDLPVVPNKRKSDQLSFVDTSFELPALSVERHFVGVLCPWSRRVRSQDRRTAKSIDLSRKLGAAAIGTLGQAFRLDGAAQQSGIRGRELPDLDLHIVNYGALFGDLLLRAVEVIGNRFTHSRVSKFVEDAAMVGVNGVTCDAGLTGELGDCQSMD
jgi:hypothetical protein